MNEKDFQEKFILTSTLGWQLAPFSDRKEDAFYHWVLENEHVCLCWIAFQKKLNPTMLSTHHFIRKDKDTTGMDNSLPRFLLVHDGSKWFVSSINDSAFKEMAFNELLKLMMEDLIHICTLFKNKKYASYNNNLKKNIQLMKIYLKRADSNFKKKWFGPKDDSDDLSIEDLKNDISFLEVKEIKDNVRNRMLDSKIKEANDLRATFHLLLLRTYTSKQLAALTACRLGEFLYVQAGLLHGNLIFIPLQVDMYDPKFKASAMRGPYYQVNPNGEISEFEINQSNAKAILKPGFVRFSKKTFDEIFSRKGF